MFELLIDLVVGCCNSAVNSFFKLKKLFQATKMESFWLQERSIEIMKIIKIGYENLLNFSNRVTFGSQTRSNC